MSSLEWAASARMPRLPVVTPTITFVTVNPIAAKNRVECRSGLFCFHFVIDLLSPSKYP
jgi:hypothetical protein